MENRDLHARLLLENPAGERVFGWHLRGRTVLLDVACALHYLHRSGGGLSWACLQCASAHWEWCWVLTGGGHNARPALLLLQQRADAPRREEQERAAGAQLPGQAGGRGVCAVRQGADGQ